MDTSHVAPPAGKVLAHLIVAVCDKSAYDLLVSKSGAALIGEFDVEPGGTVGQSRKAGPQIYVSREGEAVDRGCVIGTGSSSGCGLETGTGVAGLIVLGVAGVGWIRAAASSSFVVGKLSNTTYSRSSRWVERKELS